MKMKKNNLLILAVAALGFAACANDETTAVNEKLAESNEISFRANVNGQMRAVDITTSNLSSFKAYAKLSSDGTSTYFSEDEFTKSGSTFNSTAKHYWPASGSLDFYAYAPATPTQYTHSTTETLSFVVTPDDNVAQQVDLVVANTNGKSKAGQYLDSDPYNSSAASPNKTYGADGIPLNFRHAESKVAVLFKNTNSNLKIDVKAFKIVNVDNSATYTYTKASNTSTDVNNTDPTSTGTTLNSEWTDNTTFDHTYTVTPTNTNQIATSTAVYLQDGGTASTTVNEDICMILIPQETTEVGVYTGSSIGDALESGKTYIAVKMIIRNNDSLDDGTGGGTPNTNGTIIADASADGKWAIWPVAFTWVPGKKYIYTIDLADGGYWEKNDKGDDTALDPVLAGAEIKFVQVTVDDWDNNAVNVPEAPAVP